MQPEQPAVVVAALCLPESAFFRGFRLFPGAIGAFTQLNARSKAAKKAQNSLELQASSLTSCNSRRAGKTTANKSKSEPATKSPVTKNSTTDTAQPQLFAVFVLAVCDALSIAWRAVDPRTSANVVIAPAPIPRGHPDRQ